MTDRINTVKDSKDRFDVIDVYKYFIAEVR